MYGPWVLFFISFFALCASAFDDQDCFNAPYFKDEVQSLLREQVAFYESSLGTKIAEGAEQGFCMPWLGAMALGGYIASKVHEPKDVISTLSTGFAGGVCACICLSPLALLVSLPMSVISASMSSVKWLIAGVQAAKNSYAFDHELSEHLYQWMLLIKRGRLALRKALLEHQQSCDMHHSDAYCGKTVSCYLQGQCFERYFQHTGFKEDDLGTLLISIPAQEDNQEHLFHRLSERVKLREISDVKWHQLEERLALYIRDKDQNELDITEIGEYMNFAAYFFTLNNQQSLSILNTYLR